MEESFGLDDFEVEDLQTPNNDVERLEAPSSEMSFETIEEARKYYEDYGRQKGFWILTWTSSKGQNRSNEMTSMLFVCAKEGKYVAKTEKDGVEENDEPGEDDKVIPKKRKRSCSIAKCGCNAHMRIKRDKWSLKWKVIVFNDAHNHQLVTPSKRMKMKSNRHMSKAVKDLTETFHRENLQISKVASIFGGEYMGFDNRDFYNHLRNDEMSEVYHYKVEDVGDANRFQSFIVKSKAYELYKFTVTLDSQTYEDHFILARWRQKANKFRIIDSEELVHDDGKEESEALRLSHMCQKSTKLACLAAPSNEAYAIYIETMNGLFEKLIKVTSYVPPMDVCLEKDNVDTTEPSQILLLDPDISQTKGRKKDATGKGASIHSGRLKSNIEMALNKKKRKCNLCKKFGHDKRTCPETPTSKTYKVKKEKKNEAQPKPIASVGKNQEADDVLIEFLRLRADKMITVITWTLEFQMKPPQAAATSQAFDNSYPLSSRNLDRVIL
ncbi:hypothetical protein Vadar_021972 [Vaccinium darrowii]|uniref:Uncharacterized protein n=1 Tax=Vaccinium darrowii TaxID=229202 RepID=A0ACB7XBM1_9ERIC|nr:hypothetical protein Vadar_021972 [Vaccinium darrowii]